MGRPSLYTPELAETICAHIEAGKTLADICRDEGMPGVRTVLRWADENDTFGAEYRRAQAAHAEWLDAEVQRVSETAKDRDSAAAARVKITALTWRASKQAPKKFGDKIDLNVDHTFDLASVLDKRRQRVIEANERLGITGPVESDK